MDIDRAKQKQSGQVQCYRCRGFGHMAKDCPIRNIREIKELDPEVINRMVQFQLDTQQEEEEKVEPVPLTLSSPPSDTDNDLYQTGGNTSNYQPPYEHAPNLLNPIIIHDQREDSADDEDFYAGLFQ